MLFRSAFQEAREGKPVVLAVTNHDFRDMRPDIESVGGLLSNAATDFPDVAFRFSEAVQAMREALRLAPHPACELDVRLRAVDDAKHVLHVESPLGTFGPQPWLALKTVAGTYHHDNFDITVPFHEWQYVFDEETFPLSALSAIGVGANNPYGVTTVASLDPRSGRTSQTHWNAAGSGSLAGS